MANDLPYELWESITNELSMKDVVSLIGLNRALFSIALDRRYGEVSWIKLDNETMHILERLQEPSIAARTRRLHVRAWFISYLVKRQKFKESKVLTSRLSWLVAPFARGKSSEEPGENADGEGPSKFKLTSWLSSSNRILDAMTKAVQGMTHLTEYNFEWRDLPMDDTTTTFLITARHAFGNNLHKLVLHAQILHIGQFLTITDFHNLEELVLNFDYADTRAEGRGPQSDALVGSIAPLINHLHRTLRILSISSSTRADLVPFINALHGLSELKVFHLTVGLLDPPPSDHTSLYEFFSRHRSLNHVDIRSPAQVHSEHENTWADQWTTMFGPFISNPNALRHFTTLILPALPDIQDLLRILEPSRFTLRNLGLFGRYIPEREVHEIIGLYSGNGSLGHELVALTMEVETISKLLLATFARRLANLRELTLIVRSYGGIFLNEVGPVMYPNWQLEHLTFYRRRLGETQWAQDDWELMMWVANGLPYAKTLKGKPFQKGLLVRMDPSYGAR